MTIENVLYRATAEAFGGREGRAVSSDGILDIALTTPKAVSYTHLDVYKRQSPS